jgi:hypothetical protein
MDQMRPVLPIVLLSLALYVLAGAAGWSRYPRVWVDEGWVAEVGWTKAHGGPLGNPSHGSLHQYDQRVYWMPPLYFLTLAGVYRIVGDPLQGGRMTSFLAGGLELLILLWVSLRLISAARGDRAHIAWMLWISLVFTLDPTLWKAHRSIRFESMTGLFLVAAVGSAALLRGRVAWIVSGGFSALAALTHPTGILAFPAALGTWLSRRSREEGRWLPVLGACTVFVALLLPYLLYLAQDRTFGFANVLGQNTPHFAGRSEPLNIEWLHEWKRYRNYFAWPRLVVPFLFWVLTLFLGIRRRAPAWILWAVAILAGGFACLPNKTELYLTLIAPFLYLLAVWTGSRLRDFRVAWLGAGLWLLVLAGADGALLARNRDCRYQDWATPLAGAAPARASVAGTFVTWFAFHEHPYAEFHRRRAGDLADLRPDIVIWGDIHLSDPIFARLRAELGPFLAAHADTLAVSRSDCYGNTVALRPRWNELDPRISQRWERFGKGDGVS